MLTADKLLRPVGDIPVDIFLEDEDPEEVINGYIADAKPRTDPLDDAIKDAAGTAWVRYRAYKAAYEYSLTQPITADLADQGAVSFQIAQIDRLLSLSSAAKAEFDSLTSKVVDTRPAYGPTTNKYIF